MFKKDNETPQPQPTQPAAPPRPAASAPPSSGKPAIIGSSIHIKGQITGSENLLVEGQVEGGITLAQHEVTIGRNGKVKADISAKAIRVEGHVRGDLTGQDEVVVLKSGDVRGNITAPRVSLENGAAFKGSIDMDSATPKAEAPVRKSATESADKKPSAPATTARPSAPSSSAEGSVATRVS